MIDVDEPLEIALLSSGVLLAVAVLAILVGIISLVVALVTTPGDWITVFGARLHKFSLIVGILIGGIFFSGSSVSYARNSSN